MKFDTLNEMIPHVIGKKNHVVTMQPYNAITLAMPGRHQKDTPVPGGDFVVMVDDETKGWVKHQFTHTDLFQDLQEKADAGPYLRKEPFRFMEAYFGIIALGASPEVYLDERFDVLPGLHPLTFLYAVQCLAVAEHRRYARYEAKFGGRYLPFRFGAGIVEGLWTATDAADKQKRGRPGVEWLEKDHGTPELTRELML